MTKYHSNKVSFFSKKTVAVILMICLFVNSYVPVYAASRSENRQSYTNNENNASLYADANSAARETALQDGYGLMLLANEPSWDPSALIQSPVSVSVNLGESIDMYTGGVVYETTLVDIPGANGLDLQYGWLADFVHLEEKQRRRTCPWLYLRCLRTFKCRHRE